MFKIILCKNINIFHLPFISMYQNYYHNSDTLPILNLLNFILFMSSDTSSKYTF
jgi:hypothetical protein